MKNCKELAAKRNFRLKVRSWCGDTRELWSKSGDDVIMTESENLHIDMTYVHSSLNEGPWVPSMVAAIGCGDLLMITACNTIIFQRKQSSRFWNYWDRWVNMRHWSWRPSTNMLIGFHRCDQLLNISEAGDPKSKKHKGLQAHNCNQRGCIEPVGNKVSDGRKSLLWEILFLLISFLSFSLLFLFLLCSLSLSHSHSILFLVLLFSLSLCYLFSFSFLLFSLSLFFLSLSRFPRLTMG